MPAGAVFHPSCSRGLRRAIALLRKPASIDRREAVEIAPPTHPYSRSISERRLPAGIDRREAVEIDSPHPPLRPKHFGAPGSRATRNGCRLAPSSIPRAQGVSAELWLCSGNQPASTAERRSKSHPPSTPSSKSRGRTPRSTGIETAWKPDLPVGTRGASPADRVSPIPQLAGYNYSPLQQVVFTALFPDLRERPWPPDFPRM